MGSCYVASTRELQPVRAIDRSSAFMVTGYVVLTIFNPLTPNDHYTGRTAPLTSKRWILYIYSTNVGTECFKRGIYSQFFSLQNAVCFIILMYLVPVLFTFYIQDMLKLKENNSGAKRFKSAFMITHPGVLLRSFRKLMSLTVCSGVKPFLNNGKRTHTNKLT